MARRRSGEGAPHDDVERHHDEPAAQALHRPGRHEHPHLLREPASTRPAPKVAMPVKSGPSGPDRSAHCPATDMENRLAVK
ncbi:hypothetical protein GCM10020221_13450 [Streptomyces thioluteus]|uniref:Uncharacterized protein n=1 Tax=Streptomyces thioluteus TaxID=66431 RepID=A0ABP6J2N8_STRTU